MSLSNPWIGYITRSYQQIKSDVLTRLQTLVPEITDHTESNIYVKMVSIWGGLTEMLGYYLDNKGREAFLATAQLFASAVKIANQYDYRIRGQMAASVDLTFSLDQPAALVITIAVGTIVRTVENVQYITVAAGQFNVGDTQILIPARQWQLVSNVAYGTSDGSANQVITLDTDVVDAGITVRVGNRAYTFTDSFAFTTLDDEVFRPSLNVSKEMTLLFGDGISGKIPPANSDFTVSYYTSDGAGGNVAENTITQLVSTPVPVPAPYVLSVTNQQRAAGGADIESLADLKRNIPLSIRTKERAVTEQDYKDIAELAPGVAKSAVQFDCGKEIDIYVAPNGGGLASSALLADVNSYFDTRKILGRKALAYPAGAVTIALVIDVVMSPKAINAIGAANVLARLLDFFNVENQEIGGRVEIGDIYQTVEDTQDVKYSRLKGITAVPYANILKGVNPLQWTRRVLDKSSAVVHWKLQMLSSTSFQLFRGTKLQGIYTTGTLLTFDVLELTVTPFNYAVGDAWTFVTYPYYGSIILEEMSIPVSYAQNIQLNVTGGL